MNLRPREFEDQTVNRVANEPEGTLAQRISSWRRREPQCRRPLPPDVIVQHQAACSVSPDFLTVSHERYH